MGDLRITYLFDLNDIEGDEALCLSLAAMRAYVGGFNGATGTYSTSLPSLFSSLSLCNCK